MRAKHLPIATPCHEDWDQMAPDVRGRFCAACDKAVFDLSALTEREAKAVLKKHAGEKICISYRRSPEGVVRFAAPAKRRVAAASVLAVSVAACAPHAEPETSPAIEVVRPVAEAYQPAATRTPQPPAPVEDVRVKGDWAEPKPPEDAPCDPPTKPVAPADDDVRVKGGLG